MKGKPYKITDMSTMQCILSNISHLCTKPWWPDVARKQRLSLTQVTIQTDPDGEVRELITQTVGN